MSNHRPTVTALKCPNPQCQAEITRFRTRNLPAYVIDAICPACGKAHRYVTGFPPALTKMIREYIPEDPAPQGKTTPHATARPPMAALPIPDPKTSIQATLSATKADPEAMALHLKNVEGMAPEAAPVAKPDDLPANVPTLPAGMTEADLTAMKAQAEQLMASLTPDQKQKIKDALDGKV